MELLATRKRYHSTTLDASASAPKMPALDPQIGFADMMTVHLLNTLSNTESTQKIPLLDDLIARIQWLKQQIHQQQAEPTSNGKKVTPMGSPRQVEPKGLDHKFLQNNIQKQQEMLGKMSKLINITSQMVPPPAPDPPIAAPAQAPIAVKVSAPSPVPANDPPPVLSPNKTRAPSTTPPAPPVAPPTLAAALNELPIRKKNPSISISKKTDLLPPSPFPKKMTPEELMMDLQQKQRKLLSYISSAHNGNVTDEVLHDYLKHPYVLLKENGVVRQQPNPFFHLMAPSATSTSMVPPPIKMLPPTPISRKSTTPIPAPPVLLPQVELPVKHSSKKENTTPIEKVSPPPQLPLQVPHLDLMKSFETPATRQCNQWSVFSMALPLKLMCKCYPMPCTCQK